MVKQELIDFAKSLGQSESEATTHVEKFLGITISPVLKLPQGIQNLQDYFPTSMLIGGSYARYLEANTKAALFHPTKTDYRDIDIFIFHDITRCAMEEIISSCFTEKRWLEGTDVIPYFNAESSRHPQYKMDGIRKVIGFEISDGVLGKPPQKYDVVIVDPKSVTNFDIVSWFMKQQASELSQICAVPDYSPKGYSIRASQDLITCNNQVHLRADKCTDEFRVKLRKQAQELGYKLI